MIYIPDCGVGAICFTQMLCYDDSIDCGVTSMPLGLSLSELGNLAMPGTNSHINMNSFFLQTLVPTENRGSERSRLVCHVICN